MPDFILKISLGNEAMNTPIDVGVALGRVSSRLLRGDTAGQIRDLNGNTVGSYIFDDQGLLDEKNWYPEVSQS